MRVSVSPFGVTHALLGFSLSFGARPCQHLQIPDGPGHERGPEERFRRLRCKDCHVE
jgi:hypothetical protein